MNHANLAGMIDPPLKSPAPTHLLFLTDLPFLTGG
jgi:hypothetical protein